MIENMFKLKPFRLIITLLLIVCISKPSNAQTIDLSTQELKVTALGLFNQGEYAKAYEAYTQLLSLYPKDGLFNYYAGISLLKQKVNIPEAIKHLEFSSSKPQVPSDVYYYLGQAYRENYKFPQSRDAFNKYARMTGKNELKEKTPEREAEMSSNAEGAIRVYNPFDILATSLFSFRDTNYIRQVKGKGGQLMTKPKELFSKNEEEGELTNYMFMPKTVEKGDYIYVSGYGRSKKKGSDLFRIKKLNGNGWSEPSALDALNTPYDEIMPYFDPISKDLYFASKGHNSIGGYDIFKSHYDQERNKWSEPVRLGFPINSPSNEFLVIPGSDLGTLQLITDRQGIDNMYTVYKLHIQEPKKSLADATEEEIMAIGNLGGIAAIPSIVDIREDVGIKKEGVNISSGKTAGQSFQTDIANNNPSLKAALRYQVISDSLSYLAKTARIDVKELSDPNDRWDWQRKIIEWEKQSRDFQRKANQNFAELKLVEDTKTNPIIPSAIKKDTIINDIIVYSYTDDEPVKTSPGKKPQAADDSGDLVVTDLAQKAFVSPGSQMEMSESKTTTSGQKNSSTSPDATMKENPADQNKESKATSEFVIVAKSPYNSNNPFLSKNIPPKGAHYRIQVGVYSQIREWDSFGGISPIIQERIEDRGLVKYYAGEFDNYEEARGAVEKIKLSGFSDAFIVGWYNGQKTSVDRVHNLEKRDRD